MPHFFVSNRVFQNSVGVPPHVRQHANAQKKRRPIEAVKKEIAPMERKVPIVFSLCQLGTSRLTAMADLDWSDLKE